MITYEFDTILLCYFNIPFQTYKHFFPLFVNKGKLILNELKTRG